MERGKKRGGTWKKDGDEGSVEMRREVGGKARRVLTWEVSIEQRGKEGAEKKTKRTM